MLKQEIRPKGDGGIWDTWVLRSVGPIGDRFDCPSSFSLFGKASDRANKGDKLSFHMPDEPVRHYVYRAVVAGEHKFYRARLGFYPDPPQVAKTPVNQTTDTE